MNIRNEQPNDYREVENLTREAFWNVYRPGCTEHFVLHKYRNNPDLQHTRQHSHQRRKKFCPDNYSK